MINYSWITYKFRTGGTRTFITLVLLICKHSTIHSGLIAGGKDTKEERQTVFFTGVDPMTESQEEEYQDVSKPRMVQYKTKWKVFYDAI